MTIILFLEDKKSLNIDKRKKRKGHWEIQYQKKNVCEWVMFSENEKPSRG